MLPPRSLLSSTGGHSHSAGLSGPLSGHDASSARSFPSSATFMPQSSLGTAEGSNTMLARVPSGSSALPAVPSGYVQVPSRWVPG